MPTDPDGEGQLIGVAVEPILGLGEPPCGLLDGEEAVIVGSVRRRLGFRPGRVTDFA